MDIMKLYRYELGSDDGDEEIIAGKKLVGEFSSPNDALDYLRRIHAPTQVSIETEPPLAQFKVFAVIACNRDESLDEALWLLEYGDGA
jgi:aminopeptidase-like protein